MRLIERKIYNQLKERRLSTLDVQYILAQSGLQIPARTLQHHLDSDFKTCCDDVLVSKVKKLVNLWDEMVKNL